MVYLVDDDVDDLEIVQDALAQNSYKGPVLPINNGKKLIEQLDDNANESQPDVIVLDLNMPLMDGFQALKLIRNHPQYYATPVIILTASSRKEDEIRCFELGCNFYLNKPTRVAEYLKLANLVKKYTVAS